MLTCAALPACTDEAPDKTTPGDDDDGFRAVGERGVTIMTHDRGRTGAAVGLDHDLPGFDDLHGEPHL